jgi:predicted enzyme related to lactoylglutathione lyase
MELYMVELSVADLPAALAWYRGVLQLQVLMEKPADGFALLAAGAGRVALKQRPRNDSRAGMPDAPMLVFEVADVDAELTRMTQLGATMSNGPKESPEGYRRALISDPDGNRLCLFSFGRASNAGS